MTYCSDKINSKCFLPPLSGEVALVEASANMEKLRRINVEDLRGERARGCRRKRRLPERWRRKKIWGRLRKMRRRIGVLGWRVWLPKRLTRFVKTWWSRQARLTQYVSSIYMYKSVWGVRGWNVFKKKKNEEMKKKGRCYQFYYNWVE